LNRPRPCNSSAQARFPARAPDPKVRLRIVVENVMGMRALDGPQRRQFKTQIAAYPLLEGPKLPRAFVAELLGVSATTISYYARQTDDESPWIPAVLRADGR
jgi:hypothetical protein